MDGHKTLFMNVFIINTYYEYNVYNEYIVYYEYNVEECIHSSHILNTVKTAMGNINLVNLFHLL